MKIKLRQIRARPTFYMINKNPNASPGDIDCSDYTSRIDLEDHYHKGRKNMLAYTHVEFNFLETLAKTFIIPAKQNQFIRANISDNAPGRRIAIVTNINLALTGFYAEYPFCSQQFDLRQIIILRGGQPIVIFDAAHDCGLYVTTMKAMNFQDGIPSISIDSFKDHYVRVFDLTSMQDSTENCHYPELVGKPLRLELNFTIPLEYLIELTILGANVFGCS